MKGYIARSTPWGTIQTGEFFALLDDDQKAAVLEHEHAHIRNRDALKRLWWVLSLQIVFRPKWVFARCREQELAADAYACARGHEEGMRSYLKRFPHVGSALYPSSRKRVEALDG